MAKFNKTLILSFKDKILGKEYELGIGFVSEKKIRRLNRIYRKKDKVTDILAFPISPKGGDLVISLSQVKKKALLWKQSENTYFNFLIIHGLLHLKGYNHGKIMEKLEKKWINFFNS